MNHLFLSFAPPEKWRDGKSRDIKSEQWSLIRKKILERDNHTCAYCGYKSQKYQIIDHTDGNPKNDSNENLQIVCQMCNLIKHSGQGCVVQAVVDLYMWSKYNQNTIIKITRKMRDEGAQDDEIIHVLQLNGKAPFKMDRDYLRSVFGFVTSRSPRQKDMYYNWLHYHRKNSN